MNILIDKPIESMSEDKLKRKNFSINLAKNLNSYDYSNTMTLGLIGKWGTGKTSIINMVRENIDEKRFCIVDFNPWYFSGRKQLISDFFEILSEKIGCEGSSKSLEELGKNLKLYSKALKPFSLIPQLSSILTPIVKGCEDGSDFFSEYSKAQKINLTEIKNKINEELKEYPKKVLVIVDEIDRLENEEIKEIFQLVRALGDFNNIIYLLAFDKDRVIDVFPNREEYLDKIINIPIYVPQVSLKDINRIFISEIEKIFKRESEINLEYWEAIFKVVFENKFYNLRELNRFLNIIRFNADNIVNDVNVIDYLVISFLQLFDEKIYDLIKDKKDVLLELKDNKNIKDVLSKENLASKKDIELDKLLRLLFNNNYKSKRKISEIKYFDAYFQYNLSDNAFSIKEIYSFIDIKNKDELLIKLEDKDKVNLLFENLNEIYDKLTEEKLYIYLEVLLSKVEILEKQKDNSFMESEQKGAFTILKDMTSILPNNDKYIERIISDWKINENIELNSMLDYFAFLINFFKNNELKKYIQNKIETYIYSLNCIKDIVTNFELLNKIGVNVKRYIETITANENGVINYLESLVEVVDIHNTAIYDAYGDIVDVEEDVEEAIVLENIKSYIEYEYIKERVDKLSEDTKKTKIKLINLFYNSRPYEEVYARQIEEQKYYEENNMN